MLIELALAFIAYAVPQTHMAEYVATPVSVAAPTQCHAKAVERVRAKLPRRSPVRIVWADLDAHQAYGLAFTDARTIVLSTSLPCDSVPSTLSHEWAHQRTSDEYGSQSLADEAIGRENVEMVADCVSERFTRSIGAKRYAPYIDGRVDGYRGQHDCPKTLRSLATELMTP